MRVLAPQPSCLSAWSSLCFALVPQVCIPECSRNAGRSLVWRSCLRLVTVGRGEGSVEMHGRLAFLPVSSEGKVSVIRASNDLGIS